MNRTLNGDVQISNGELGISQCVWCRHRSEGGQRCRAYPKGIPRAILMNLHDHRDPYEGDFGVRFEPEEVEIEIVNDDVPLAAVPLSAEVALEVAPADLVEQEPEFEDTDGQIDETGVSVEGDVFDDRMSA
jgi:hypothetical protein